MKEKQLKAGLYIRVSTEKQVREGYSVSAQKENLSKFATQQNWKIFDIYADEGISGKNIQSRPEVKRLINDIKDNKIDVVILYKFDRLTRDSKDTEDIIELIQQYGIQVFTLAGGIVDVSTATGRFSVRISGAVAQLEREQTIERIKVALAEKVKQGYTLASATTCYGYDRKKHEKEQTINEKEAKVVKRIYKMYLSGKKITEICDILNTEKIPTKKSNKAKKSSSIWMPKTIRQILTNPTYIGKVRYHIGKIDGFVANGNHKSIISKEIWNKTQLKIKKQRKISRTNYPKEDAYYCGTLVCGICGKKLTSVRVIKQKRDGTKKTFVNYRCINKEKKLCKCSSISHSKVESEFQKYIENIEPLTEFNEVKIINEKDNRKELNNLENTLSQVTKKEKEVMNLFLLNNINNEQLEYMTKELNRKSDMIKKEINNLKNIIKLSNIENKVDIPKEIKIHWNNLSNREKYDFLTEFIENIKIVNYDKKSNPQIINVKFYTE